ncbi:hypothetical protein HLB25_19955 [Dickeya dadantii]|uniref:hypothetical protein n=1 Tax=Dickeya dadantii TaxID=204038 RepID=UPI0014957E63|nr:hypothetical protein [Dickeya dadantii]NPE55551.1 hypothetical protein [Dickeya dadantii]NPE68819.1 hypothetical protein [Dickeya dadantii]
MEYIPIILAFASALVAIIGNTWDKAESGLKKLTTAGRFTFTLIVFALIYSLVSTYQQRDQKQHEELEKKKLGKIINTEITKSLNAIASPFRSLYIENNGGKYIDDNDISFDLMLMEPMLEKAQRICLELRPKTFYSIPDSGTWNDIFRTHITSGIGRLDRLVDRYGVSMSVDMLDAINDLQVNGYFSGYAYHVPRRDSSFKSKDAIPVCAIGQAIGVHKVYLEMLKRIETLNNSEKLVR